MGNDESTRKPTIQELVKKAEKYLSDAERLRNEYSTPLYLKKAWKCYEEATHCYDKLMWDQSLSDDERKQYLDKSIETSEKMNEVDNAIREYRKKKQSG